MILDPGDLIKILLAVAAGGLIGIEREYRDKAAGFRTLIFISSGACLFTILSAKFALDSDPNRIAANIVTGVGFLGAGVIMRSGGRVIGLTTAAAIWLTAAVGMGIGGGEYALSAIMVIAAMVVLWLLPVIEHRIDNVREERTYEVVCAADFDRMEMFEKMFRDAGLRVQSHSQARVGSDMTLSWSVAGSPENHTRIMRTLFDNPEVKELRC